MIKLPIFEFVQHSDLSEGYGLFNKEKGLKAIFGFNSLELSNKNDSTGMKRVYLGTYKETFQKAFDKTFIH